MMLTATEPSLKKQSYWLFTGRLGAFCIQFVTPVLLVRLLTKSDYGLYQFVITIVHTLLPVLTLGFNNSLYYFYPNAGDKRPQLLTQTFGCIFIISSLIFFIFLIFYPMITDRFNAEITNVLLPAGFIVYFLVISSMIRHIIILEKKAFLNAAYLVIEQACWTSSVIVPIFIYRSPYYGIWGLAFFSFCRTLFFLIYLMTNYSGLFRISDFRYVLRQIKYVVPIAVGESVGSIGRRTDRFVVSAITGLADFASYAVATFKIPMLTIIFRSIFQVAVPKLSEYSNAGDIRSAKLLWHKVIETAALVTVPSVILFQIMAEQIVIVLFTDRYLDAVLPFRILLLMPLFQMTGYGLISRSFNKTGVYLKANLVMLSSGLISSLILTPAFGIFGASVSAVIAFAALCSVILNQDKIILKLSFMELLPFEKIISLFVIALTSAFPSIIFNIVFKAASPFVTLPISSFIYITIILYIYHTKSYISINLRQFLSVTIQKIWSTSPRKRSCNKL
jgi:O-antigen/teichoic acid export membrane protein